MRSAATTILLPFGFQLPGSSPPDLRMAVASLVKIAYVSFRVRGLYRPDQAGLMLHCKKPYICFSTFFHILASLISRSDWSFLTGFFCFFLLLFFHFPFFFFFSLVKIPFSFSHSLTTLHLNVQIISLKSFLRKCKYRFLRHSSSLLVPTCL